MVPECEEEEIDPAAIADEFREVQVSGRLLTGTLAKRTLASLDSTMEFALHRQSQTMSSMLPMPSYVLVSFVLCFLAS